MGVHVQWPSGFIVDADSISASDVTADRDGVPWDARPIPRRWHRCRATTIIADISPGPVRLDVDAQLMERCACGAIRIDGEHGMWRDRNTRKPYLRAKDLR